MKQHLPSYALVLGVCLLASSAAAEPMARDQLFFVGRDPVVLLAIILQRVGRPGGADIEAKVFLAYEGHWKTPLWERVSLEGWPGDDLSSALELWRSERTGAALRLKWSAGERSIDLKLRSRSGGIELHAQALHDAGSGRDPHGPVTWLAGPGTVVINGREIRGTVVLERLTKAKNPWPRFHRFEMWLLSTPKGLVLGRVDLTGRAQYRDALHVPLSGVPRKGPFEVAVLETRADPDSGFALPIRWRLKTGEVLEREAGSLGRGDAPGGGPAVYDISHAVGVDNELSALVFHLQDEPRKRDPDRSRKRQRGL